MLYKLAIHLIYMEINEVGIKPLLQIQQYHPQQIKLILPANLLNVHYRSHLHHHLLHLLNHKLPINHKFVNNNKFYFINFLNIILQYNLFLYKLYFLLQNFHGMQQRSTTPNTQGIDSGVCVDSYNLYIF
jgi:hypothetical protein